MIGTYPFKYLVFEGTGVLGVAYAGVCKALDEKGLLNQIKGVAGSSSGSFISLLIGLGYKGDELVDIYMNLPLAKFLDGWLTSPFRLLFKFGLFKGDYLTSLFSDLIAEKVNNPHATFKDLFESKNFHLATFGSNLSTGNLKTFDPFLTPDFSLAKAVRISSSVPLLFAACKIGQDIYGDGGILRTYAINYFDDFFQNNHGNYQKSETLGIYFGDMLGMQKQKITSLWSYISHLLITVSINQQQDFFLDSKENKNRTIFLDTSGINPLNFFINKEQKKRLIDSAYEKTMAYLEQGISQRLTA